jgi:UDP-glucose 4-epimerase
MRYVITGGSGYIGTRLVDLLSRREDTERIVICDVAPPRGYKPKTEYERLDVRDRAAVRSLLERSKADVLVHLAFILNPSHDEQFMYEVDVNGTQNALEAAADAGTGQVLVTTSVAAYGAFPDNPVPLTEDDPVRGVASFSYARDKTESDRLCQLWAKTHPERVMTIVRPSIVFGPNVDNYLVRLWTKQPFVVDVGSLDQPLQFVHEDDVVDAITGLLLGRHAGAFNVAGGGTITSRECAELVGTPIRKLPLRAYRGLARAMWAARLSESPPGSIEFALYPWIVSTEKLEATTGWKPAHTTRETFEITMRAHGKLPPEQPPAAAVTGDGIPIQTPSGVA